MNHLAGKFGWFEHVSHDPTRACRFYESLFDWNSEAMTVAGAPYRMIYNGHAAIAGMRAAADLEHAQWIGHVTVDDLDSACRSARSAGARILSAPGADTVRGLSAQLADPWGARIALSQPAHGERPDEPAVALGDWYWHELWTPDEMGALAFYQRVLGYGHETLQMGGSGSGAYYILKKNGVSRAGMTRARRADVHAAWLPYVAVEDCDGCAARAQRLGGRLLSAPRDAPGIGRVALLSDPLDAAIAVIRPEERVEVREQEALNEAAAA